MQPPHATLQPYSVTSRATADALWNHFVGCEPLRQSQSQPHQKPVFTVQGEHLFQDDLQRLRDGQWLSSIAINAFVRCILSQHPPPPCAVVTLGTPVLLGANDARDVVILLCCDSHFLVAHARAVAYGSVEIIVYDSLGPPFPNTAAQDNYTSGRWPATEQRVNELYQQHVRGRLPNFESEGPSIVLHANNLRQNGEWECGRACCLTAERLICGMSVSELAQMFPHQSSWKTASRHILFTLVTSADSGVPPMMDVLGMKSAQRIQPVRRTQPAQRIQPPQRNAVCTDARSAPRDRLTRLDENLLKHLLGMLDRPTLHLLHSRCNKEMHKMSLRFSRIWDRVLVPIEPTRSVESRRFQSLVWNLVHLHKRPPPVLVVRLQDEYDYTSSDIDVITSLAVLLETTLHLIIHQPVPGPIWHWRGVTEVHCRIGVQQLTSLPTTCKTVVIEGASLPISISPNVQLVWWNTPDIPPSTSFNCFNRGLLTLITNALPEAWQLPDTLRTLVLNRVAGDGTSATRLKLNRTNITTLVINASLEQVPINMLAEPGSSLQSVTTLGLNTTGSSDQLAVGHVLSACAASIPATVQRLFPNLLHLFCSAKFEDPPLTQVCSLRM